eukprot:1124319-Pleurochrysis_carterae.AAC.1
MADIGLFLWPMESLVLVVSADVVCAPVAALVVLLAVFTLRCDAMKLVMITAMRAAAWQLQLGIEIITLRRVPVHLP